VPVLEVAIEKLVELLNSNILPFQHAGVRLTECLAEKFMKHAHHEGMSMWREKGEECGGRRRERGRGRETRKEDEDEGGGMRDEQQHFALPTCRSEAYRVPV
jgi:hypothetical protein